MKKVKGAYGGVTKTIGYSYSTSASGYMLFYRRISIHNECLNFRGIDSPVTTVTFS